jgi:oligopeptide transport system substrate-binding protein
MKARSLSLCILAIGLGLVLAWAVAAQGPGPEPSSTGARTAGDPITLNLNLGEGPFTLDPARASDSASINVVEQLFVGLVDVDDETAEVRPELATGWTVSPDGTVYTFTLRSDAAWSDGHPVTAEDVRYGILRSLDPATESGYAYVLTFVVKNAGAYHDGTITDTNQVGVTAVDTTTLRVTLEGPAPHALSILSMGVARPVPRWAIEAHGVPTWTEPANIVTNGPYRLAEWVHDDHILLEKDPTYYGAADVQIERVKMWIVDQATAWQMYLDGQLDTTFVPYAAFDQVRADPLLSQELVIAPKGCTYYYGFNTTKPPVDNVHMRRALSHAVDRLELVEDVADVIGEGQKPAQWFCRPGMAGCPTMESHPDAGIKSDPNAARVELQAYMDEMGYASVDEIPEILLMYNTLEKHRRIAEYISQAWMDDLGVTVVISDMEWHAYLDFLQADSPPVWRLGWCLDYPDANNWTRQVFAIGGHEENATQWRNEEFTALCEEAALEPDPIKRQDMYAQAETILCYEDAAIIPLYWYTSLEATKPYLERTYPACGWYDIATWRLTRVSGVIDPGGGELTSYDGDTTIRVPAGAVTRTIVMTHAPAFGMPPGGNLTGIGHVFDVTAVYSSTDPGTASLPVQIVPGYTYTITVRYTDTELGPAIEDTLGFYWWDEDAWSQEGIASQVNVTDNVVTAEVDHFSRFAVLGVKRQWVYLPIVLRND